MRIRPYKETDKFRVMDVLNEAYKDINPTIIINEETGLYKSSKRDSWGFDLFMLHKFFKTELN
ncbi:MAG: hypothetical protein R3255_08310 [Candidatus Lokiarchaeia archaeon]|nr:hypothetical protein [Candidatus Lokiarchaeia archaeon]